MGEGPNPYLRPVHYPIEDKVNNKVYRWWLHAGYSQDVTELFIVRHDTGTLVQEYWIPEGWVEYKDLEILQPALSLPGYHKVSREQQVDEMAELINLVVQSKS